MRRVFLARRKQYRARPGAEREGGSDNRNPASHLAGNDTESVHTPESREVAVVRGLEGN